MIVCCAAPRFIHLRQMAFSEASKVLWDFVGGRLLFFFVVFSDADKMYSTQMKLKLKLKYKFRKVSFVMCSSINIKLHKIPTHSPSLHRLHAKNVLATVCTRSRTSRK